MSEEEILVMKASITIFKELWKSQDVSFIKFRISRVIWDDKLLWNSLKYPLMMHFIPREKETKKFFYLS